MRVLFAASFLFISIVNISKGALIVNAPIPITHTVTVNPIVVSGFVGGLPTEATFFGTASQQAEIEVFVDVIMSQAGIDVQWMPEQPLFQPTLYDSATFLEQYAALTSDTVESTIPEVVNMWFVAKVPGTAAPPSNGANGLAFVDSEGLALAIGSDLPGNLGVSGREAIAGIVAHELSHNLGLEHPLPTIPQNLMESSIIGHRLEAAQRVTILTDSPGVEDGFELAVALVPEPSSTCILLLAMGSILLRRRNPC